MTSAKFRIALFVAASLAATATAGVASANGCNGYVNQMVWGCAPWDHNNGPQFPHYVKPGPAAKAVVAPNAKPLLGQSNTVGGYTLNGSGIVAQGGGNFGKQN